jgi:hypothetical protein
VAALADPRAAHDPGVRGVEPGLELGVGDHALGQRRTDPEEPGHQPAPGRAVRLAGGRGRDHVAGGRDGHADSPPEFDGRPLWISALALTRPPACA